MAKKSKRNNKTDHVLGLLSGKSDAREELESTEGANQGKGRPGTDENQPGEASGSSVQIVASQEDEEIAKAVGELLEEELLAEEPQEPRQTDKSQEPEEGEESGIAPEKEPAGESEPEEEPAPKKEAEAPAPEEKPVPKKEAEAPAPEEKPALKEAAKAAVPEEEPAPKKEAEAPAPEEEPAPKKEAEASAPEEEPAPKKEAEASAPKAEDKTLLEEESAEEAEEEKFIADLEEAARQKEKAEGKPEREQGDYVFVNVMEQLVRDRVLGYMEEFANCTCSRCVADTIALALTRLPAKYVVVNRHAVAPLMNYYSQKYTGLVTVEITKACIRVNEHPHHGRD